MTVKKGNLHHYGSVDTGADSRELISIFFLLKKNMNEPYLRTTAQAGYYLFYINHQSFGCL